MVLRKKLRLMNKRDREKEGRGKEERIEEKETKEKKRKEKPLCFSTPQLSPPSHHTVFA